MSSNIIAAAHQPRATRLGVVRVLLNLIRRAIARNKKRRIRRAAIDQLSTMSEHELKDIGLSRGAIDRAVNTGFAHPPSPSRYY